MFCYKCGNQIPDDAQFCSKCGTAQKATVVDTFVAPQPTSKDLDREAIKIYLSNVLALECFIQKLTSDYNKLGKEISKFDSKNYIEKFQCSERRHTWLRYDGNNYYVFLDEDQNGNYYLGMNSDPFYTVFGIEEQTAGKWFPIDENLEYLNNSSNFPSTYAPFNLFAIIFIEPIVCAIQQKENKNGFWNAYERFKNNAPQKYEQNVKTILPSKNKRKGVKNELEQAKELLSKAYQINIIPKQYRNIHAMWFIHDFVTTSNETLSGALLHCDLDEIKKKLDKIIEQNNRIIRQNAIQIAQNSQIMGQNQQMLNRLASIESNTDRAAQYAEIAANNAEACAWIGMANYIKD